MGAWQRDRRLPHTRLRRPGCRAVRHLPRRRQCRSGAPPRPRRHRFRCTADCGSVGLGQFPVGRTPFHRVAAHGHLDIAPAHQNGVSAPHATRPGPGVEKFCIRLMTRAALVPRAPAAPEQPAIHRDARRTGKPVGPLRSAARSRTTTAPVLRPGHKQGAVPGAAHGARQTRKRVLRRRRRAMRRFSADSESRR